MGEEMIIAKIGKPVAKLVSVHVSKGKRFFALTGYEYILGIRLTVF